MGIIRDARRRARRRTSLLCRLYQEVDGVPGIRVPASTIIASLGFPETEVDAALKYLNQRALIGSEYTWGRGKGLEIWITTEGIATVEELPPGGVTLSGTIGTDVSYDRQLIDAGLKARRPDFPERPATPDNLWIGSGWTRGGCQPGDRTNLTEELLEPHVHLSLAAARHGVVVGGSTPAARSRLLIGPLIGQALERGWPVVQFDTDGASHTAVAAPAEAVGRAIRFGKGGYAPISAQGPSIFDRLLEYSARLGNPRVGNSEFFASLAVRILRVARAGTGATTVAELRDMIGGIDRVRELARTVAQNDAHVEALRHYATQVGDLPPETLGSAISTVAGVLERIANPGFSALLGEDTTGSHELADVLLDGHLVTVDATDSGSRDAVIEIYLSLLVEALTHRTEVAKPVVLVVGNRSRSIREALRNLVSNSRLNLVLIIDGADHIQGALARTRVHFRPASAEEASRQAAQLAGVPLRGLPHVLSRCAFPPDVLLRGAPETCVVSLFDGEWLQEPRRVKAAGAF